MFAKVPHRNDTNKTEAADDKAFSDCLKKHLILGVPGSGFAAPGWIRFAYCVDETVIRSSQTAFAKAMTEWTAS
jgi:aspartate aminotransferase